MCDAIEKYVCYVIFEKKEVGVLPRWASCPTLPYSMLVIMDRLYIPVIILHLSIDSKNSSTAYVILYELIGIWVFGPEQEGGSLGRSHGAGTSSPSHWQQVEEQAPKLVGWMMCFLLITFVPVHKLCVNIYIYVHSLYEFCYRTYMYIQHECHSVLVKLHQSHSIGLCFWGMHGSWVECHFLFSLVYQLCLALW